MRAISSDDLLIEKCGNGAFQLGKMGEMVAREVYFGGIMKKDMHVWAGMESVCGKGGFL